MGLYREGRNVVRSIAETALRVLLLQDSLQRALSKFYNQFRVLLFVDVAHMGISLEIDIHIYTMCLTAQVIRQMRTHNIYSTICKTSVFCASLHECYITSQSYARLRLSLVWKIQLSCLVLCAWEFGDLKQKSKTSSSLTDHVCLWL